MSLETQIQLVSLKAHQFMETSVAGWFKCNFTSGKLQLRIQNFTVIPSLPSEVVKNLSASILQSKDYEQLKQYVLSYGRTKPRLLDKLMKTITITGRPSVYLQNMLAIARRERRNCYVAFFFAGSPEVQSPRLIDELITSLACSHVPF